MFEKLNKASRFAAACGLFLMFAVMLPACQHKSGTAQSNTPADAGSQQSPSTRLSPDFNADSALSYVKAQVAFGPRIPGTEAHARCASYLVGFFKRIGVPVFVQHGQVKTYNGKVFDNQNIIASFNPAAKIRVMLSAHYDARPFSDHDPDPKNHTKPFDAANDAGSGVAAIMEIARNLKKKNPGVGVDMMLWDVEDYGTEGGETQRTYALGTQFWAAHPPVPDYHPLYCINLDMVGGKNAIFYMEKISMENAPGIVTRVWDIAHDLGYSSVFSYTRLQSDIDDDHKYINDDAKIPAIDILDYNDKTGFYTYWHTQGDVLANMDPRVLKAAGQTVLETIYREAKPQ